MIVSKKYIPQRWFFFNVFDGQSVLAFKNLSCNVGVIFFNKQMLNQRSFLERVSPFQEICRKRNQVFLVHFESNIRGIKGSNGVFIYLKDLKNNFSSIFNKTTTKKNFFLSTSIHNEKELISAFANKFDIIFISPLSKTRTHPELSAHSPINFIKLCYKQKRIVFALGGVTNSNFKRVRNKFLIGFGAISFFLKD